MKNTFLLLTLGICLHNNIWGQKIISSSDKLKPRWIKESPNIPSDNIKFISITALDLKPSLNRNTALDILTSNLPREWSVSSRVETVDEGNIQRSMRGIESSSQTQEYTMQVISEGAPVDINCQLVDNYWEEVLIGNKVHYEHFQLYQVAQPHYNGDFYNWYKTTNYGAHGLWRSAIVPGWGQLYKGSKLKGGCIMGGCAALIAGIIVTENQRSVYSSKITKTHSVEVKRSYANKADNMAIGRNIFIGATAALYIYNLVDAIVAPGARRVVVKKRDGTNRVYSFSPVVTPMGDAGLSASVEF